MIPSPNHSGRGGKRVSLVVIHTAEGARTVESLGGYFSNSASQVSSHVGIDDNRTEQYVDYSEAAWTAQSANQIADQAELCGFAAWTRDNWLNDHHRMLELAAQWIAERCRARGIPIVKLTPARLAAGESGVIGHVDWTVGMRQGSHTDPGSGFPWDVVMQMAAGTALAPAPPQGMNAAILAAVMGNVAGVPYDQYVGPFIDGMLAAGCTTVNRAAMWCAQLGEESGGLRWMEEIADGSAYEGRKDLGNTQSGDGKKFKGRGPLQVTGRQHYADFGAWCHVRGLVDSDDYFTTNPTALAQPRWGFLAATWYWTVERPTLNAVSDAGDVVAATRLINGGTRGLADRQARYTRALTFGAALLPGEPDMDARQDAMLTALYQQVSGSPNVGEWVGWPAWDGGSGRALTPVDYLRQLDVQVTGLKAELETVKASIAGLAARQAQP